MSEPYFEEKELQDIKLFQYVSLESIKGLLDSLSMKTLVAGEVLIATGMINRNIYLLLSGKLNVYLDTADSEPIAVLEAGESAGEMSVVDHQPTSAFVVAAEPCRLLVMDEDILWSLVQSSHAAACNLLFILTKRLRQANSMISEGLQLEQKFQHYGTLDALTGVHNRHWLDTTLGRQCHRAAQDGTPFSMIMIDVDHFKKFNTDHGHLYGDRVLYSITHTMGDLLRPTEMIARYGGDEFVVLTSGMTSNNLHRILKRLENSVISLNKQNDSAWKLSWSFGVSYFMPGENLDLERLIERADTQMYKNKAGKSDPTAGKVSEKVPNLL